MRPYQIFVAVSLYISACQSKEPTPPSKPEVREEIQHQAAALEATLPLDVREKLASLRRQSEALPRPTNLDLETLKSIKDEDLDFAVSWYIGEKVRLGDASERSVLDAEPFPIRHYYLAWLLEAEVLNGGFNQYFWNMPPELVSLTSEALSQVGAPEVSSVLKSAYVQAMQEEALRKKFKSQGTLQAFSDSYKFTKLAQYDDLFVKLAGDLPARRIAYLRAHEKDLARVKQ